MTNVSVNITLDPQKGEALNKLGYSIFPFLSESAILKLRKCYFDSQEEEPTQFYSSTHSKDYAFRKRTSEFIKEVVSPLLHRELRNYKLLGGAFVVKPPKGKGLLPPHQDWNIVDENSSRSFNLWIPLSDVNIDNGAVFVLPGSHSKISTFRGPGIASIFRNIEREVWQTLTPLPMKAGQALLYDHALLHASPVNGTDQIRLGIVCGVVPENTKMQLCFGKEGEIEIYSADEHFFLEKDPMKGPEGLHYIGTSKPLYEALSLTEFETLFLGREKEKKLLWIKKILGID